MDMLSAGASLAVILGLVGGAVVGIPKWQARKLIPFETAREWRSTLQVVDYIFQTSIAEGGCQGHPWQVRNDVYDEAGLQHSLDDIKDGTKDEELRKYVSALKQTIRDLYASCYDPGPYAFTLGVETEADRKRWALMEKFSNLQLEAADLGREQVAQAIARLNERSAKR